MHTGFPNPIPPVASHTPKTNRTVPVSLGDRSYDILVVGEPFDGLPAILGRWSGAAAALVSDRHVDALYGDRVERSLAKAGLHTTRLVLAPGEGTKSFAELERLLESLIAAGIGRQDVIVALGGGVVGDLVSLAASLLRRGVSVIQLPTSLVAQVDSAVGGKTAINSRHGKNLVGTFHQPAAVLAATGCLATLPDAELRAGLGEVVKYALLVGEPFLSELERDAAPILALDPGVLAAVVVRCLEYKADLVQRDERDGGARRLLNLGHTLGHALERAAGYGGLRHGEAVAIGLVGALVLSTRWCGLTPGIVARVRGLLAALGLPSESPPVPREALRRALLEDKKRGQDELVWVALPAVGEAELRRLPLEEVEMTLDLLVSKGVIQWETP